MRFPNVTTENRTWCRSSRDFDGMSRNNIVSERRHKDIEEILK